MSVAEEHRMSPSKVLVKTKKAEAAEDKNGDNDKKQSGKANPKSNAMLDFIAKCKKNAKN